MKRGLEAVRSLWRLICATHNLLKLFRSGSAKFARMAMNTGPVPVRAGFAMAVLTA